MSDVPLPLSEAAGEAKAWLFQAVLPLWSTAGFDPLTGQFQERLSEQGEPLPCPRRLIVQARQLFVFAAAGRLGWEGPWRDLLSVAARNLLRQGRGPDGDWIFDFDPEGRPRDRRRDLYTQAFVLFGLTHAGAALDRAELLDAAAATADALDGRWRHPAGGYEDPGAEHRRQNPHMHLLESFLALHAATGDPERLRQAEAMAELFRLRFQAPTSGALLEYFDTRLGRAAGEAGRTVEPGHEFEWTWLLDRLARGGGRDLGPEAERLFRHAEGRGVAPSGLAYDEIWEEGPPKRLSHRLWPQTERLKAGLVRWRRHGRAEDLETALSAWRAMQPYFDMPVPGTWRDRALTAGGWEGTEVLASSGYHVVCAIEDLVAAGEGRA